MPDLVQLDETHCEHVARKLIDGGAPLKSHSGKAVPWIAVKGDDWITPLAVSLREFRLRWPNGNLSSLSERRSEIIEMRTHARKSFQEQFEYPEIKIGPRIKFSSKRQEVAWNEIVLKADLDVERRLHSLDNEFRGIVRRLPSQRYVLGFGVSRDFLSFVHIGSREWGGPIKGLREL